MEFMGGLFLIIMAGILADTLVKIVKHRAGATQLRAGLEDLRHQFEDQANRLTDAQAAPGKTRTPSSRRCRSVSTSPSEF